MSRTRASADNLPGELTETTKPACWAAPQSAQGFQDADLVETRRLEARCDGVFAIATIIATGRC